MRVSYVAEVTFDFPEARYLRAVVKPILEDSGECEVSAHELSAFIQPQKTGTYRFKYIYEIAGETWVDNVKIKAG